MRIIKLLSKLKFNDYATQSASSVPLYKLRLHMSKKTQTRGAIALLAVGALAAATSAAQAQTVTTTSTAKCSYVFNTNLTVGTRSTDVMNLQKVLNMNSATAVATTGAGSMGNETTLFGPATRAAVIKYQKANGITPAAGFVGALTRASLNQVCTGTGSTTGSTTGTTTNTSGVQVALAANQPTTALVAGQAGAVLANVVLSGNGTVQNIVLARTGVSSNDVLQNVYLFDGATRLTDAASVASDNTIRFNNANIAVNGSRTITVRADIATTIQVSTVVGQIVGVAVTGYTMSGSTTVNAVSAQGNNLLIAGATTATASMSTTNKVIANGNLTLPQTNYSVWGTDLQIGTRAALLKSVTVKMIGSAPTNSLTNVGLVVNGVRVASASADANGRFVFDLSAAPRVLATGSHLVEVRADVVAGSSRSFYFTLENAADLMVEDSNLGVNVNVTNVTSSNAKNAGTQSIGSASNSSVTLAQDSSFTTTNVVAGTSNAPIAKFRLTAFGEDTKVQYVTLNLANNSATTTAMSNVALYVNGAQVGSTNNSGTQTMSFNLGSQFMATAGVAYTLEVRADMVNRAGVNIANGTPVRADVTSIEGQGMSSQNTFNRPGTVQGQSITIGGSTVNFGKTIGAVSSTISKNQTNVKIASFQLQAGSIEDITVNQLTLALGGDVPLTSIQNVRITDGSSSIGIPSASNNFNVSYDLAKGSVKTIDVTADLGEISSGSTTIPSLTVSYRGKTSNTSATTATVAGDTLTAAVVTVNTPTATTRASSQYVLGGKTQQVATFNVTATNGAATVNDLTFSVTNGAVQSLSINGVTANVVGSTATFFGINLAIPQGSTGINIPVVVTYVPAYTTGSTPQGVLSGTIGTVTLTGMKTTASGVVATPTVSVAANAMTLVTTLPTVAKVANSGSTVGNAGAVSTKLGSIKVSADVAGALKVKDVSYSIAAPAAVSNLTARINGSTAQDTAGANATVTATKVTFAAGYRIDGSGSVTIDIFGDIAAGATTSSVTDIAVGAPADFTWTDDVTGTTYTLTGNMLSSTNYVR